MVEIKLCSEIKHFLQKHLVELISMLILIQLPLDDVKVHSFLSLSNTR